MQPTLSRDYSPIHLHPFLSSTLPWFFKAIELTENSSRVYLEIGVAAGETFSGVCHAMDMASLPWRAIGVDLATGGWEFNQASLRNALKPWGVDFLDQPPTSIGPRQPAIVTCGSEVFLRKTGLSFDLVFIDACHSTPCCTRDFILVEPKVKAGGIVIFHDADPDSQGDDFEVQPHCQLGIGVRRALQGLDLLKGGRQGWKLLADTPGAKGGPRGSVIIQRT